MPLPRHHVEQHFTATDTVRDIVIGMSDGLTVPFALAAGLSGAAASSRIVVLAGLAEIAAGSIAMGLGGFLAARTDLEHYNSEVQREIMECREMPREEEAEVARFFEKWGLSGEQVESAVKVISSDEKRWVDFMMQFELGLEEPDPGRALRSALTIGGSYVIGGLVPLLPYMLIGDVHAALLPSIVLTVLALLIFGYVKGRFTGVAPLKGALQTASIGGAAAAAAFAIARLFR